MIGFWAQGWDKKNFLRLGPLLERKFHGKGKMMCTLHSKPRTGNRVEPSAHRFLAEGSDKRLSTRYLRPNIQPIYQEAKRKTSKGAVASLIMIF